MRPQHVLRAHRPWAILGALGLAYAAVAGAPAVGADSQGGLAATVTRDHLRYGEALLVTGRLPGPEAGHPVTLEFASPGKPWTPLAQTVSGADGSFRISGRVTTSGAIRVAAAVAPRASAASSGLPPNRPGSSPGLQSAERPVAVEAAISTSRRHLDVLARHRAVVSGVLAPAVAGRAVALEVERRGHWKAVAHAVTSADGRYRLGYTPRRSGSASIRVRFPGDVGNAPTLRELGHLNVYRIAQASWYGGGGGLACGGQLAPGTMGVANKTLPCGTRVTLRYHGRRVRVRVIDRGPYVAGRDYDLTAATKRALGFPSTGAVWTTR